MSDVWVVAVDYAGCGEDVAHRTAALAAKVRPEVVLVYVVQLPPGAATDPATTDALHRDAYAQLSALAAPFADHGLTVRLRVEVGAPAAAILRTAEAERATLIAVGTHGRTGVARLVLGSVAEQVVRAADVPVLTLRSPGVERHPTDAQRTVVGDADG